MVFTVPLGVLYVAASDPKCQCWEFILLFEYLNVISVVIIVCTKVNLPYAGNYSCLTTRSICFTPLMCIAGDVLMWLYYRCNNGKPHSFQTEGHIEMD